MDLHDKALNMIGIAHRARKICSGEMSVDKSIKNTEAYLVIVATDASDNTKKHFNDKCTYYDIPIVYYADKESIGNILGKEIRTSVAIEDEGLAQAILKAIKKVEEVN